MASGQTPTPDFARETAQFLGIIKELLKDDHLSCNFLRHHNITITEPCSWPQWLPEKLDLQSLPVWPSSDTNLRPPELISPWEGASPRTAFEWAGRFHDTAVELSHTNQFDQSSTTEPTPGPLFARPRTVDLDNPWEYLLAHAGSCDRLSQLVDWEVITILETAGFTGCIAYDNGMLPASQDDVRFSRTELVIALTLVCRQLCDWARRPSLVPHDWREQVAMTIATFTKTNSCILQAYVEWPDAFEAQVPSKPQLRLARRFQASTSELVAKEGGQSSWYDVASWVCFAPPAPVATRDSSLSPLLVLKQRCEEVVGTSRDTSLAKGMRDFTGSSTSCSDHTTSSLDEA